MYCTYYALLAKNAYFYKTILHENIYPPLKHPINHIIAGFLSFTTTKRIIYKEPSSYPVSMIDIKLLRDNPERYKKNMLAKGQNTAPIDNVLEADVKWRSLKKNIDTLRSDRNNLSKKVNDAKKAGDDATFQELLSEVKKIPEKIKALELQEQNLLQSINTYLATIPNIMSGAVPQGKDDSENKELSRHGPKPTTRDVVPHQDIATTLNGADFESSRVTSGNGFYYLQGDIALLNQALIRYGIEHMVKRDFTYVETPLLLRKDIINRVTDIHDQQNMIYKIEDEDLYLIGTSEHSLIGRFIDSTVNHRDLPIKQTSYSMCFRREKGSHGLDERGLFRTHQFNKVEMIVICEPEQSQKFYEELQQITLDFFTALGLPTRVLQICSGDLGNMKHDQVDIEVWSPRQNNWIEVGSCSNLTDAQARSLGIRTDKKTTPHTLNNTCVATSRTLVAILENYQNKDGSITIPEVLQPYMFGKKIISKK